jgi:hypothetical protein
VPREAAVAHQQVAAQADEEQRLVDAGGAQEGGEVVEVGRHVGARRRAAGAPADVARHRLVEPQLAARFGLRKTRCSSQIMRPPCASFPGTPPIDPAPMVSTTSPSRADVEDLLRHLADVLDEHRLHLAGTRIARASERPSAATIGASPAGYTSASSSASTSTAP